MAGLPTLLVDYGTLTTGLLLLGLGGADVGFFAEP
jgi:hypothetical protein